ncbi:tol-pal system-associated acyl-CoA thioesterase [Halomonas urumqiensis]|uniref:Tol-pal system-associated acyl-CoA thioesterase n=1 Tax=Halomonas urumqiensis TaxID=1684789 RepID=A0A2N7UPJ9_9GAMM|nr:tol-pal system-associated acyl-CoA thioesterase [Halomonas urumqiensis]PMR82368.1 tol-pal system-associated acyl-CoA thioesterase [Halomonas urumqiensis]PTB04153.1 tol-pal system-associated acyl-CoA thioesterase [Halomonas urumqiensis]GHE19579.1 tol-pal system-associated acyl-CoA thioesterase [Halomonas urumqiensis]
MSGFHLPVRVYIEDTDAGGIVYYVNYLKFMERARSEWLRHQGFTQAGLFAAGIQLVVHRLECRYARPARLDDALEVSADIVSHGRARLQFAQRVTRDGEPLCEASVDIACLDAKRHKPVAWPPELAARLIARHQQQDTQPHV